MYLGAKNFECSALSGVGCQSPFQSVVDDWLETHTPKATGGSGGQDKGKKSDRTFRLDPEEKPGLFDGCCSR